MPEVGHATGTIPNLWSFGDFDGPGKWSGCTEVAGGRVVCSPWTHPSILLFDPKQGCSEEIGNFGDSSAKFAGCATLKDGSVVFVPLDYHAIVILNPVDKTFEEIGIGSFNEEDKWSDCCVLSDGRVVFAPSCHDSILLFDPTAKTWEEVGNFRGESKFSACVLLDNGKVLFVPEMSASALLFNPETKTTEEVGRFDADLPKWNGGVKLPDGRVFFVPCDAGGMVFNPADKSFVKVGNFSGEQMFRAATALPDGQVFLVGSERPSLELLNLEDGSTTTLKTWSSEHPERPEYMGCTVLKIGMVVIVPACATEIIVVEHACWHAEAVPPRKQDHVQNIVANLWSDRTFTDAVVEAGVGDVRRSIPVHRAVLASASEVFSAMFVGPFREGTNACVQIPEDPQVVEAVLRYLYTGELVPKDPLQMLTLAHRLGLRSCVAASAAAIDKCDAVEAIRILVPLLGDPAVNAALIRVKRRIREDEQVFHNTLVELVEPKRQRRETRE